MTIRRWVLLAIPILAGPGDVVHADPAPRLTATWKEKDAKVEAFSPDGRAMVASGGEGYRLRDTETWQVRAILSKGRDELNGLRFSPDGRLLFATQWSDRHAPVRTVDLKVWDVAGGKEFATIPYISEHQNASTDHYELSADGKILAFLDHSERLPMRIQEGKIQQFDGLPGHTFSYNASPGLARVKLWDIPGWKETATLDGGSHMVFSPDGKTLITGARDWKEPVARVWDTATGRLRRQFDSGGPWVRPMTVSPDGQYLAIGNAKDQVLQELAGARRWSVADRGHRSNAPFFAPGGRMLFPGGLAWMRPSVGGGGGYACYDLTTLPPRRLELETGELAISPDGLRYAAMLGRVGSGDPFTAVMHDLPALRESGRIEVAGLRGAAFSPKGRWLALLVGRNEAVPQGAEAQYRQEIRLLDPTTCRVATTIPSPGQTWGDHRWEFSPDEKYLALSYRLGTNTAQPGEESPSDRPLDMDIWQLRP